MSFKDEFENHPARPEELAAGKAKEEMLHKTSDPMVDAELEETLSRFRSSVHAWSEAAYRRPRAATHPESRKVWRLAAGWALGCALVAGGVSGGIVERHHRQEMARIAVAQVEQRRLKAEQQAREEEDLLAKVDSDVSREVPSAMEPLAQLMAADETQ